MLRQISSITLVYICIYTYALERAVGIEVVGPSILRAAVTLQAVTLVLAQTRSIQYLYILDSSLFKLRHFISKNVRRQ